MNIAHQIRVNDVKTGLFNSNNGIFEGFKAVTSFECGHCHESTEIESEEAARDHYHVGAGYCLCSNCMEMYNQNEE
jgi:hypothetical protein